MTSYTTKMKPSLPSKILSVLLIAGSSFLLPLFAQSEDQIERFREERKAYFEEKMELTPEESKAFWPLYNDFNNRKMRLMEEERNTFRYIRENVENLSEEEQEELLQKILKIRSDVGKLDDEYYGKRFLKVLPAEKVLLLFKVEWDFRRHLLQEIRGQGPRDGKGRLRRGSGFPDGPGGPPPPDEIK